MKITWNRIYKPNRTWSINPFTLFYTKFGKVSWLGLECIFIKWGFCVMFIFGWPSK